MARAESRVKARKKRVREKLFDEIKEGSYSKEISEELEKLKKAFERVDYYSSKEYTEELIRMFEK